MTLRILSDHAALGFQSKPQFNTSVVRGGGGKVFTNQVWSRPLEQFQFSFNNSDPDDIDEINDLFMDIRGGAGRFLMKNWRNYQMVNEVVLVATGGETSTQIIQNFGTANPFSLDRKYIVSGSDTILNNGVPLSYSLNVNTGIFTHSALSAGHVITVSCEFYYKCRFLQDGYFTTIDGPQGSYQRIEQFDAEEDRS